MRFLWTVAAFALATLLLLMAGCSGDGTVLAELSSGFAGSAVKGPIADAEVKAFHFDPAGTEVEITAINAPVYTDAAGSFEFRVAPGEMASVTSPIIVRTMGGTMFGRAAPVLEGVIPDPEALTYGQVTLDCQLSTASCVAAGLLKKRAEQLGAAPQPHDADEIFALVEAELDVDLSECPADAESCVARVNHCVDQNLDLKDQPESAQLVGDFVDYLVANLSSSSEELDDFMADPANPAADIPASFAPFGTLATVLPGGPTGYVELAVESDRPYIGIDGSDTATIRATLTNACGHSVPDAGDLVVTRISGNADVDPVSPPANSGELQVLITATAIGNTVVEITYALDNGNDLRRQVTIQAVDLLTDTDGDGRPDGLETIGWTVVVDMVGYGDAAVGKLLTVYEVTSDPSLADTDGDGLSDYTEYLYRTDPRSLDTDGDGLNDHEECYRWITNPCSVDTDGDARGPNRDQAPSWWNFDGNELTMLKTSPTLEDTDGDGWTDFEEADHPTRSPIISDLPKLEIEIVDDIDVRLDVQYAEQVGQTSQYGTEFMKSHTAKSSYTGGFTVGASMAIGVESKVGLFEYGKGSVTTTISVSQSNSWTNESSDTSQESYSKYTTDSRTRTETAATGSMTMGIRLRNTGQIAYTITQLGMTARFWVPGSDPDGPGSYKTLATLVPALQGGFTLTPGAASPVLQLEATGLNASRVKEFLAKPDDLLIESAYYDLENAEELNFAYLEQITGPQTARILIDFGQGKAEEYRVATNVNRTPGGGWAGILMKDLLRDGTLPATAPASVLDHIMYRTVPRTTLEPGATTNEDVLDTLRLERQGTDWESQTGEDNGLWRVVIKSDTSTPEGTDFEDIVIHGGDTVLLMYVRDTDDDGLNDGEEDNYNTDLTEDTDGDGLKDVEEIRGATFIDDDENEIPCAWEVKIENPDEDPADPDDDFLSRYAVVSDPTNADQDGDGLNDYYERGGDLVNPDTGERERPATDPTRPDTDDDGLRDDVDPYPAMPARVLRVKADATGTGDGSSWVNAHTELWKALADAKTANSTPDGKDDVAEIWVAAGVYKPRHEDNTRRDYPFDLVQNVSVFGGFTGVAEETKQSHRDPNPLTNGTILSGEIGGDNCCHVVRVEAPVDEHTILDGFAISDGYAVSSAEAWKRGGGIYITGNVTLRNLLFRNNYASDTGGAVYHLNSDSTTSVINCIFSGNTAGDTKMNEPFGDYRTGGAISSDTSNQPLTIRDCTFDQNGCSGGGGAIHAYGKITITGCSFRQNFALRYGGAISQSYGEARLKRCRFTGNWLYEEGVSGRTSLGGAVYARRSNVVLAQCTFFDNRTQVQSQYYKQEGYGGAVYVGEAGSGSGTARLYVINCSFAYNHAEVTGGAIMLGYEDVKATVVNSILYGNTADRTQSTVENQIDIHGGGSDHWNDDKSYDIVVRNSFIQNFDEWPAFQGWGNLGSWRAGDQDPDKTPGFSAGESGDLRLSSDSVCIDAGSNYVDYDPLTLVFDVLPELDLAGNQRIVDGNSDGDAIVDMGAYEFQGGGGGG